MTKEELLEMVEEIKQESETDNVSRETVGVKPGIVDGEPEIIPSGTVPSETDPNDTSEQRPDDPQLTNEQIREMLQEIFRQKTTTTEAPTMSDGDRYLSRPESMTSRLLESYGIKENGKNA